MPVLIAQLPLDSQRATVSHSASGAACACAAIPRAPPLMTAPVTAILAALIDDVEGLLCRPITVVLS